MSDAARFDEDLPGLAVDAAELAPRLCHSCQNFHLLWPYLRLARATEGCSGATLIDGALNRLLAGGHRTILIAGAADTGVLAVVARAVGTNARLTVLDRCETPLELCRRFAERWSLPIETLHVDLMEFSGPPKFDVVLAHSILQFIPAARRLDVLSRLRRALRPDGHLVISFRRSAPIDDKLMPGYRDSYPKDLIERLDRAGMTLPEPRENFLRRLAAYSAERAAREGAHTSREEVERLIEAAGFVIESVTPIESGISSPFKQFAEKLSKQRFLAIAKSI